jgi:hypothetical protein
MEQYAKEERNQVELSPFLSGTNVQYAYDSTSLGYLKRCPRLYQYMMIEGYESKDESVHLRFGIEYHDSLREYEVLMADGYKHDEALAEVVYHLLQRTADWDPNRDTPAGKFKNPETLLRTVVWYLDEFEHDEAKTVRWKDGSPAVEQSFRFELDWGPETARNERGHWLPDQPYVLCGHLDKVVEYQGEKFGMDHKTTTRPLYSNYFNQYEPENQMTLYTLATKIIFNTPVRGMIVNAAQIGVGFSRFARGITYRTADQLTEWLVDLKHWLNLAEHYAKENYWPQNDTACDKYGGCKFREICSQSPKVRERLLAANFTKLDESERWNPLRTR